MTQKLVIAFLIFLGSLVSLGQSLVEKREQAHTDLLNISNAIKACKFDIGRFPDHTDHLFTPYFKSDKKFLRSKSILTDPWGNPCQCWIGPKTFELICLDENGTSDYVNGDDDIVVTHGDDTNILSNRLKATLGVHDMANCLKTLKGLLPQDSFMKYTGFRGDRMDMTIEGAVKNGSFWRKSKELSKFLNVRSVHQRLEKDSHQRNIYLSLTWRQDDFKRIIQQTFEKLLSKDDFSSLIERITKEVQLENIKLEPVVSVELAYGIIAYAMKVNFKDFPENVASFFEKVAAIDNPPIFWTQLTIRPDNLRNPQKDIITGRIFGVIQFPRKLMDELRIEKELKS